MNKTCLTIEKRISEERLVTSKIDFKEYKKVFEDCFQKCKNVFNDNSNEIIYETQEFKDGSS